VFVAAAAAAAAVVGVGMGSKPYLLLLAGGRRFSHSAQVYAIAFATTRLEGLQHDVPIDVVDGGHRHGRDVVVVVVVPAACDDGVCGCGGSAVTPDRRFEPFRLPVPIVLEFFQRHVAFTSTLQSLRSSLEILSTPIC